MMESRRGGPAVPKAEEGKGQQGQRQGQRSTRAKATAKVNKGIFPIMFLLTVLHMFK